jgi:hypothetical protein
MVKQHVTSAGVHGPLGATEGEEVVGREEGVEVGGLCQRVRGNRTTDRLIQKYRPSDDIQAERVRHIGKKITG